MRGMTAEPRRYGNWGGQPNGYPENLKNCRYEVFPTERGRLHHQCNRKRGHGLNGWFCKQHAKYYPETQA